MLFPRPIRVAYTTYRSECWLPSRLSRARARLAGGVQTELGLMSPFGLDDCLSDFSATARALVGEVDRYGPMGLDVSYVHRKS
jgi:hypothetical protein